MSEKLGVVAYEERSNSYGPEMTEKHYSEETAKAIDAEVKEILDTGYALAKKIILEHREQLELMTEMLMEFETLDSEDVQEIVLSKDWDRVKKKARLKQAADAHIKGVAMPPPPPPKDGEVEPLPAK